MANSERRDSNPGGDDFEAALDFLTGDPPEPDAAEPAAPAPEDAAPPAEEATASPVDGEPSDDAEQSAAGSAAEAGSLEVDAFDPFHPSEIADESEVPAPEPPAKKTASRGGKAKGAAQPPPQEPEPAPKKPAPARASIPPVDGREQSFLAALSAARKAPENEEAWTHLEEVADNLQRPDEVADLYQELLAGSLSPDVRGTLAERAVEFCQMWFVDTPDRMTELLSVIVERDADAEWAFERLTMELTNAEKWDELLKVYDRLLEKTTDEERRRRLLDDAAHVAKDFAHQSGKAADYISQLLVLEPTNAKLVSALERLFERDERWRDLIDLWRGLLPQLPVVEGRAARLKIAVCALERLRDPEQALEELGAIVGESPDDADAARHLESILAQSDAPVDARRRALALLRKTYEILGRPDDVIRVIEGALDFADGDERRALRRELASRLAILGRDNEAMAQYRELLVAEPNDTEARKQLRQLGPRAGRQDLHADALVAAAAECSESALRVSLLLDAAHVRRDALGDTDGAIALFFQVLETQDAEPQSSLSAAHSLDELLAKADRTDERLVVLERLAVLERSEALRYQTLQEAALLADRLGDPDRALTNWKPVLEAERPDPEALAAVIDLLERNERWPDLLDALERRAATTRMPLQRRADWRRAAEIRADKLDDLDGAIRGWQQIRDEFGDDQQVVDALDQLLAATERWEELAEVLERAASQRRGNSAKLLGRLGDVFRTELSQPDRATRMYRQALGVEPTDEVGRAGLTALLEVPTAAGDAAAALAWAYDVCDDWAATLSLVEPRVSGAADDRTRVRVLVEAAKLSEQRAENPSAAVGYLARALPLEPENVALQAELLRLAGITGEWRVAADALGQAAVSESNTSARAADLRIEQARLLESELGDFEGALAAQQAAAELRPGDADRLDAVTRVGAQAGSWDVATAAFVESCRLRDRIAPGLVEALEQAAGVSSAWTDLAQAADRATTGAVDSLPPKLAAAIETQLAVWYRERCEDPDSANDALRRALQHDPSDRRAIEQLAAIQRQKPGPELVATLLKLDDTDETGLDALNEAARVAVQHTGDSRIQRATLDRLYAKARRFWVQGEQVSGESMPSDVVLWAVDRLVEIHDRAGQPRAAIDLLLDASGLPCEPQTSVTLLRRAGELLVDQGERLRAIEAFRSALRAAGDDIELVRRLVELSEAEEFETGSVALRRREVELTTDSDARLALRLATSKSAQLLEKRGGRVDMLLANLEEVPGHEATIEALWDVLTERGRFESLAELLEEQAGKLADADPAAAAKLYARAASIAEQNLRDPARAIAAHGRVVDLAATNESLDALAKLHTERAEPAKAAEWLERRLQTAGAKERVAVLLRLARARIAADQREAAVTALKTAFEEAPRNAEVRKLLIGLHRQREDWKALAGTLAVAAEHATDETTVLTYGREAAEIYHQRIKAPEQAVPVLRKVVALAPDDRKLRAMLAEGLRAAGEIEEAEQILAELIAAFGRRGSQERAGAHLQLARVLRAQGRLKEATDQLDVAAKMDAGNITILYTLAELAKDSGQLDRAERGYRSLLLTLRRLAAEARSEAPVGAAEVLVELSRIATEREQDAQAAELVESALEALAEHDGDASRLQARLREQQEHALLLRVIDARLGQVLRPHLRAELLAEKADVLDSGLGRAQEALEARFAAVECEPASPVLHDAALELSVRLDKQAPYLELIAGLLDRARRETDAHVRCELLLRHGEVYEKHHGDLDRAAEFYSTAESTGVREVDVWRAQARLAGARGDEQEQVRLLSKLASLGEAATETRTDALYRIAEVQLASEDTVDAGVESLAKAFAEDSRAERAALVLRRAADRHADNEKLLDLYEQVARQSAEPQLLLHYLERRAMHATATPDQAREAVDKAFEMGDEARADALMLRAVDIGRDSAAGLAAVDWALLRLAERRKDAGDIAGAVKWLEEATEVVDVQSVFSLGREVAQMAAEEGGDLTLAGKLYEKLWEQEPTTRETWQPLADIYLRLGEMDKVERIVTETLDGLQDAGERNELRVMLASGLMAIPGREEEATSVLRDVLNEDPTHELAHSTLAEYWERTGNQEGLIELLRRQLDAALAGDDPLAVKTASLRLGQKLLGSEPSEVPGIYRSAIERCPDDAELISALLGRLGPEDDPNERAELTERLLAIDPGSDPGSRALELVELYRSLDKPDAVQRALELGYRLAPENEQIRALLEERFRESGDFAGLARMLLDTVDRTEESGTKATLLREVARVQRQQLMDTGASAATLRRALEVDPSNHTIVVDLAETLQLGGDAGAAVEAVSGALSTTDHAPPARLELLRKRAGLRAELRDEAGAVSDLEEAFAIEPDSVAAELEAALEAQRSSAAGAGDQSTERSATMRLVDVMRARGNNEGAQQLLGGWLERAPDDVESLRRLHQFQTEAQHWDAVIATCERLIDLDEGEAQEDAAMALLAAYELLGRANDARGALEAAREKQPTSAKIRGALRRLYEQIGAHRELARLLIEEADAMDDLEQKVAYLRWAGQTLVMVGDVDAAVPALNKVLELAEGDVGAAVSLADAHMVGGQFDEADRILDEAINDPKTKRNNRDMAVFVHRKAHVARARGDMDGHFAHLQKAHQSDTKNGDIAAELADVAEGLEQWDIASKALRAITLLDGPCRITPTQSLIRQGRISLRQGDKKRALMFARRAKRGDEPDPEVDAFMKELEES